ncbi:hypothetical protein CYMTET_5770 [Cymbomonas tetramitiformis]|uniref:Uncharacterized protein n=1 Tax=Cymbomonas tetramitiformis TaxID=36881 RepID=A0AAE0LJ28_9CHLO|nr:hypothetical protein CYMTET_5770 [Cymbomonas tetramitiformis]
MPAAQTAPAAAQAAPAAAQAAPASESHDVSAGGTRAGIPGSAGASDALATESSPSSTVRRIRVTVGNQQVKDLIHLVTHYASISSNTAQRKELKPQIETALTGSEEVATLAEEKMRRDGQDEKVVGCLSRMKKQFSKKPSAAQAVNNVEPAPKRAREQVSYVEQSEPPEASMRTIPGRVNVQQIISQWTWRAGTAENNMPDIGVVGLFQHPSDVGGPDFVTADDFEARKKKMEDHFLQSVIGSSINKEEHESLVVSHISDKWITLLNLATASTNDLKELTQFPVKVKRPKSNTWYANDLRDVTTAAIANELDQLKDKSAQETLLKKEMFYAQKVRLFCRLLSGKYIPFLALGRF